MGIIRGAQPKAILTTTASMPALAQQVGEHLELDRVRLIATDAIDPALAHAWRDPAVNERMLAYLQYTSGSSASPKGVMITHGNLMANLSLLHAVEGHDPRGVSVTWLPHFHDMGLVAGLLHPLSGGFPGVVMSPAMFVQRPFRWLGAVSQYGATISGGPNSAYELCVQKVTPQQQSTLDLSRWRMAFNGSEPVFRDTLDRFAERFASAGFRREALYPSYGLAEATLMVSGHESLTPATVLTVSAEALAQNRVVFAEPASAESRSIVGCGHARPGCVVAITDPDTCVSCAPGEVGEIWVAGPSVTQGYWENPEATAQAFHAYQRDTGKGPFLRTGDLGFVHDRSLFVTGRLKDLIIVGGRNHYPDDIEDTVEQSHAMIRAGCCAAFSVDCHPGEALVFVAELGPRHARTSRAREAGPARRATAGDLAGVAASIRRAVWERHELPVHDVVFLAAGSIPMTTSGKIRRRACRDAYLGGRLSRVG